MAARTKKSGDATVAGTPSIEDMDKELGERLRRLRKREGYTQAELADRVGLAEKSLSRIEAGKLRPRLETLYRLREALGAGWGELFAFADVDVETALRLRLVRQIMEASPAELQTIDAKLKGGGQD